MSLAIFSTYSGLPCAVLYLLNAPSQCAQKTVPPSQSVRYSRNSSKESGPLRLRAVPPPLLGGRSQPPRAQARRLQRRRSLAAAMNPILGGRQVEVETESRQAEIETGSPPHVGPRAGPGQQAINNHGGATGRVDGATEEVVRVGQLGEGPAHERLEAFSWLMRSTRRERENSLEGRQRE